MINGEDIIAYGRRAVKTYQRIGTSGVPESHFPSPKQQARRFIEGLSSSIPTYNDYKNYLSNSLAVAGNDFYSLTLVEAINCVTKFHRGAKITASSPPTNIHHSSLSAAEVSIPAKRRPTKKNPRHEKSEKKTPTDRVISDKPTKDKSKITCYNCGKLGHYSSECRSKKQDGTQPTRSISAAVKDGDSESFYTTFGQLFDKEDDVTRGCMTNIITADSIEIADKSMMLTAMSASQSASTEAIFDTGATGTIITNASMLFNIQSCTPTNFKGIHGSMRVTRAGQLLDIGLVHYDPRAGLSVVSASDVLRQGHQWEFTQGSTIDDDAFLVHTDVHTYTFRHRRGLYVADLATPPDARHTPGPIARTTSAYPTIVRTPNRAMVYTNSLPTTASNAADFTRREVQRSTLARRFQASLGFPPDDKFITALNAGTFLNCDILPADVRRATIIWGPSTAALKGRTTRQRPLPPPQAPLMIRAFNDQHMHCDLMFVNKQPFLVSITHPVGLILVSSVDQVSAPYSCIERGPGIGTCPPTGNEAHVWHTWSQGDEGDSVHQ
jgi:Zinc knuckle